MLWLSGSPLCFLPSHPSHESKPFTGIPLPFVFFRPFLHSPWPPSQLFSPVLPEHSALLLRAHLYVDHC